ncbi:MAG TPA: four helix bundle protein [Candidatus Binatia bacterium]|nr:four helix bundle protein [Candidatus Binatia bacterium]
MDSRASFRDIKERTFEFALEIVKFCRSLDERPGIGRTLGRQLLRSGTSIGADVEEAQAGQSRADFISKYSIALKETRETIYWLRLLDGSGYLIGDRFKELASEAEEISRVIGTIIVNAKKSLKR